jgi:hypothetical protein
MITHYYNHLRNIMMNKYIAPWYLLENYKDYRRIRLAVIAAAAAAAAAVDVLCVLSIGDEVTCSGGTIAAYVNRTNGKILTEVNTVNGIHTGVINIE